MTGGITYHPKLYVSSEITPRQLVKIQKLLSKRPLLADVYLITYASNPSDMLEFYESKILEQSYFKKKEIVILGLAKNYNSAMGLMETILKDCLAARNDCNVRAFFTAKVESHSKGAL